jgi:rhodanese-related sulfurtransferase
MPLTVDELLERARRGLRRVSPRDAASEMARGALLVDIRPADQRDRDGEIPGALAVGRNVLEWRLDPTSRWRIPQAADHEAKVMVICAEGYSSSLAAASLQELGLVNATDVIGGFEAWAAEGLPVRRTADGAEH